MSERGFILVDKPSGFTSHDAVARVRRAIGIRKVGHAGTLDPMATGLLVCGIGPATKLMRFIQDLPKEYVAQIKFGIATDSLDADGEEVWREPMDVTADALAGVIEQFTGPIFQVPPMVSALKVGGKRLHELARQGIEVEREARPVEIHSLQVIDVRPGEFAEAIVRVVCSKGTYIRVLADDIAQALGGRAHLTALRRMRTGHLGVDRAVTIDRLDELASQDSWQNALIDPSSGLESLPECVLTSEFADRVRNGARLTAQDLPGEWDDTDYRMTDLDGTLLAVYHHRNGTFAPEVVLP